MDKILKVILLVTLLLSLLISSCSHSSSIPSSSTPSSSTPAPTQENKIGTQVGNLAPDFQLDNLEGQTVSLSDLQGKPVLINFWATWCPPCRAEMPYLEEVYREWSGKGVVLLAINIGETSSQVKEFLQSHSLSLPVLLDTGQNVARRYNIQYIPTTFFIDKDGTIQIVKVGAFTGVAEIEKSLNKIVP